MTQHGFKTVVSWHSHSSSNEGSTDSWSGGEIPSAINSPIKESFTAYKQEQVCCAFKTLQCKQLCPLDLSNLTPFGRQQLFRQWVANERMTDETILRAERYRCPCLWCRQKCDDAGKLLDHIRICEWLADGEYLCYEHQQPERFSKPHTPSRKVSSKLRGCFKNACKAIKRVGSVGSGRSHSVSSQSRSSLGTRGSVRQYRFPTLETPFSSGRSTREISSPVDLIAGVTMHTQFNPYSSPLERGRNANVVSSGLRTEIELPGDSFVYEIDDPLIIPNQHQASNLGSPWEPVERQELSSPDLVPTMESALHHMLVHDSHVLDTALFSTLTPDYYGGLHNQIPDYTIQATNAGSMQSVESCDVVMIDADEHLDSAFTSPQVSFSRESFNPSIQASESEQISVWADFSRKPLTPIYDAPEVVHPPTTLQQWTMNNDMRLTNSMMAPQVVDAPSPALDSFGPERVQDLVEILRNVSSKFYMQSIQNLRREPMHSVLSNFVDSMPTAGRMLQIGLMGLRKFFSGSLPTTAVETHALLHVACVAALVINQEGTGVLEELFNDVMNWSHVMRSTEERVLFIKAAHRIWASASIIPSDVVYPELGRNTSKDGVDQPHFTTILPAVGEILSRRTISGGKTVSSSLCRILRGGKAIQMCTEYFDRVEYALLRESKQRDQSRIYHSPAFSPSAIGGACNWKSMVTDQLLMEWGLEGFFPVIIHVSHMIDRGAFRDLRELELTLINYGRKASRSKELYCKFLKATQALCNKVHLIDHNDLSLRDVYYIRDLDNVYSTLCEVEKRSPQQLKNKLERMTNKRLPPIQTAIVARIPTALSSSKSSSFTSSSNTSTSTHSAQRSLALSGSSDTAFSFHNIATPSTSTSPSQSGSSPSSGPPTSTSTPDTCPSTPPSTKSPTNTSKLSPSSSPPETHRPLLLKSSVTCTFCGSVFTGFRKNLQSNLRRHHAFSCKGRVREDEPPNCSLCKQVLTRSDNLLAHMRNVHRSELRVWERQEGKTHRGAGRVREADGREGRRERERERGKGKVEEGGMI